MKKLVLTETVGQEQRGGVEQPAPGQAVYVGVDVSRSKWVYDVRWGGQSRRKLSTPGELRHLQSLVEQYSQGQVRQ